MHRRQLIDYLALACIWGVSFILLLRVVEGFGWAGAVAFRALAASAILVAIAWATRRRLVFGDAWRALAVVGATTVAAQLLGISFATPLIGTAMAAIFAGTIPLFSMVFGRLWGTERLSRTSLLGLALGFGGIVLLVGFPAEPMTESFIIGCTACTLAMAAAAFGSNHAARHLRALGSWEQTVGSFFVGGLIALPLLFVVPVPGDVNLSDLGTLLLLAGLCSSLAYVLYFRLVAEVGPTLAISVEFGTTVIAVTLGAVLLHERLSVIQLVGAGVIILGCALVIGLIPGRRAGRIGTPETRAEAEAGSVT